MTATRTVLVTGCSGFIAKHIVLQLLNGLYNVVGSLRSPDRANEVREAVLPHLTSTDDIDNRLRFVELDLLDDKGWDEAMRGIDILIHTASPFPMVQPEDENNLIRPAVDGTLRALRAASKAGVERVILTSSVAAVIAAPLPGDRDTYNEDDWSDVTSPSCTPYLKSKTMAEQAAWKFARETAPEMKLTVINPGLVLGEPLDEHFGTSLSLVQRALAGKDPMLPRVGFTVVDVVDIARMHVAAIDDAKTYGERFIGADNFLWYVEMAKILKQAFPDRKIPTRQAPDFVIRFLSLFDSSIKTILPDLGKRKAVDNGRARDVLGISFVTAEDAVRNSARFLVERKLV